jgi:hypothetical protein
MTDNKSASVKIDHEGKAGAVVYDGSRFLTDVDMMIHCHAKSIQSLWSKTRRSPTVVETKSETTSGDGESTGTRRSLRSSTTASPTTTLSALPALVPVQVLTSKSLVCDFVMFPRLEMACEPVACAWQDFRKELDPTEKSKVVIATLRQYAAEGDIPIVTRVCMGGAKYLLFPSAIVCGNKREESEAGSQ